MKYVKVFLGGKVPKFFKGTDDAVRFGEKATPLEVEELTKLWEKTIDRAKKFLAKGDLENAMHLAHKSQFFREAIEAAKGIFPQL